MVDYRNVCGFAVVDLVFSQIKQNRDHDEIANSPPILFLFTGIQTIITFIASAASNTL